MHHYKKYKDSFAAALIIIILTGLCFLCFYPSTSKLSKFIGVLIAYAFILAVSIITALIMILIKSKESKHKYDFLYNFIGTLNILIGFTGLILAIFDIDTNFICVIISCLLGLIIYHDIYSLKGNPIR